MQATYRKSGLNYLSAIRHDDGRVETLPIPLASIAIARKFAQLEISDRRARRVLAKTEGR